MALRAMCKYYTLLTCSVPLLGNKAGLFGPVWVVNLPEASCAILADEAALSALCILELYGMLLLAYFVELLYRATAL